MLSSQTNALAGTRTMRRRRGSELRSAMPLMVFVCAFFLIPIGLVLKYAIYDTTVQAALPQTMAALDTWSGKSVPDERVFRIFAQELKSLQHNYQIAPLAQRIGYEISGGQVLVSRTARRIDAGAASSLKAELIDADPRWSDPAVWRILKASGSPVTTVYLRWATGTLHKYSTNASPDNGSYDFPSIIAKTLLTSVLVTFITVLLGYPIGYVVAERPGKLGGAILVLVLIPFWTSLLVRSMSWVVLLQGNGLVVELLRGLSVIAPGAQLLYTGKATVLAMTQIQLPFTILPMIAVMKSISPVQLRAARSLGAGPFMTHFRIYFPQALPGVAAGAGITFILCLGFYITPTLVGGPDDQMVSYYVARFTNTELNWNLAAALSLELLILTVGGALVMMNLFRGHDARGAAQ